MSRYFFYGYSFPVYLRILILLFLFSVECISQTKTNLEALYSLNDLLVNKICNEIPNETDQISLKLNLGETYSVFSNHITNGFIKRGKNPTRINTSEIDVPEINIVLDSALVFYGEVERDGWFGEYVAPRTVLLRGNYLNSLLSKGLEDFNIAQTDTIKVDQITLLETDSFPFTKGKIPPEPFLSSLIEPVIAIGVAAVSIILFFSVRSK
jgi:hypothetical protein